MVLGDRCDVDIFKLTARAHSINNESLCTWILGVGFEAAKTALWPSRGLHHFGEFLDPSDELAGQGCCCFLMR